MATHSSVFAWRIPGMVEPGGLPSMGSHRVGHDWSDLAAAAAAGYLGPDRTGFCLRSDHQLLSLRSSGSQILITTPRLGKAEVIKGQLSLCLFLCVCVCVCVLACSVAQLCPTLCDPMDGGWPGISVHGILQARILDWVAISSSRGSSWPRDQTWVSHIGRQILYHCSPWEALLSSYLHINNSEWVSGMPQSLLSISLFSPPAA